VKVLPFPQFAGDDHFAAGLFGKSEHLRQAEPGALADLLGGEEGFEDASELVLRYSDAGVLDGDGDITVRSLRWRGRPPALRRPRAPRP